MHRRLTRALLALALLFALAACGSDDGEDAATTEVEDDVTPAAAESAELKPISVGYLKIGAVTDLWVAEQEGFFEDHGLSVEIKELQIADIMPALQSGSVDVVLQIPGTSMSAVESGLDLVCVFQNETAGTEAPSSNGIMVAPDSGIETVADLAGKKLAVSTIRGQGSAMLKKLLTDNGVEPDDVQLLEVPFPAHMGALQSGQVDAVAALDPFTSIIRSTGVGEALSYYMIDTIPDQPVGAWWTKRDFAETHADEFAAFADGLVDAIEYLQADLERGRALIAEFTGMDPATVEAMPLISWKYEVDLDVWEAIAEAMVASGDLKSMPDIPSLIAPSLERFVVG